jgi:2-oxoisovalerate dehydrogenase E1 component alpha subunit
VLRLVGLGAWSEAQHAALTAELDQLVQKTNAEAQSHGVVGEGRHHDPRTMFEDVFKEMPWHLREEEAEYERLEAARLTRKESA